MELTVNETMAQYGAGVLTVQQLVEVILGNANAAQKLLHASKEPLRTIQQRMDALVHLGLTELQAQKMAAVVELIKRYNDSNNYLFSMSTPGEIYRYLRPKLQYLSKEHFVVLALNSKNKLIAEETVSVGSLTGAAVHPREVYKVAINHNAAAIVVAHNHPSGDPTPSREDKEVTEMLKSAGKALGIPLLDHLVIGMNNYYSFMENDNNC